MGKDEIQKAVDGIIKWGLRAVVGEECAEISVNRKALLIEKMVGLRQINGLSREEMARRMNVDIKKVVAIESLADQEDLTLCEFRKYVEALGFKAVVRIERNL